MGRNTNMKVWIAVAAIWLCWSRTVAVGLSSKVCPKKITSIDDNNIKLGYSSLSFNIEKGISAESYSKFLSDVRDEVKSDEVSHGKPVLCERSKVLPGKEYLLVELIYKQPAKDSSVTLVIDVVNVYLMGYKAGTTAYFFKEDYQKVKNNQNLFPGTTKKDLGFDGSYARLGDNRDKVPIGMPALRNAVDTLHKYGQKEIKPSLVTVIETISEAARNSLIEKAVTDNFIQSIRPSALMISYENNWGDLSTEIQNSDAKGMFQNTIVLKDLNKKPIKNITNFNQVKDVIAILNYKKAKLTKESLWRLAGEWFFHHENRVRNFLPI